MNKANCWHSMARVKCLGVGDKPYKTFFTLVKIKQQRETMSLLINDSSNSIEDEGEILGEVEQFYTTMCSTSGTSSEVLVSRNEILNFSITHVTNI